MVDIEFQSATVAAGNLCRQQPAQQLSEHRRILLAEAHEIALAAELHKRILDCRFNLASKYICRALGAALTCIRRSRFASWHQYLLAVY
jgi:hypothetical protein